MENRVRKFFRKCAGVLAISGATALAGCNISAEDIQTISGSAGININVPEIDMGCRSGFGGCPTRAFGR